MKRNIFYSITGFLLVAELLFCAFAGVHWYMYGSFPGPIYFDTADSFMDLYHTIYWSWKDGRFDNWHSIYPSFVFLLANALADPTCITTSKSAFELRACDGTAIGYLILVYVLACVVTGFAVVRGVGIKDTKGFAVFSWSLIALLSVAGLFALERGNTILLAFLCVSLVAYYGDDWRSAIAMGIAASIKPYLLALLLVPFVKLRFNYVALSMVTIILSQCIALIFLPDPLWTMLVENMTSFATLSKISVLDKLWFPTSIVAYIRILDSQYAYKLLQSDQLQFITLVFMVSIWIVRAVILVGLALLCRNARKIDSNVAYFFIIIGLLVAIDSLGGYGLLFLLPFFGAVLRLNISKFWLLLLMALLLPLEIPIWPNRPCVGYSFLRDMTCTGSLTVSLWSYFRPLILIALLLMLISFFYTVQKEKVTK